DQALELVDRVPQRCVFEKQPRREPCVGDAELCKALQLRGIEVETNNPRPRARVVPCLIYVAGRHEREFPCKILKLRSRQTLDECLSIAVLAPLVSHEQMNRCSEAIPDNASAYALDGLCRHSMARNAATYHEISGCNFDCGMRDFGGGVAVRGRAIDRLTMAAVIRL